MARQPFKGKFKAGSFDFVLLTVHTSPGINVRELEGLEFFHNQAENEKEPDAMVLGDLSAKSAKLFLREPLGLQNSKQNTYFLFVFSP